jgi:type I restriction enzyme M protein
MTSSCSSPVTGKLVDFISGKLREDTPEERVRQNYARTLHEKYGYPKEHMEIQFPIKRGSKGKKPEFADISVFNSRDKKQNNIFLLVETKSPAIKHFDYQLGSYVTATTAQWCVWTNGQLSYYFSTNIGTKRVTKFSELWDIPHYGQRLGAPKKTDLVAPVNLALIFETLHDYIWANANIKKPDRITANLTNILFCKIYDELSFDAYCKFCVAFDENEHPDINTTYKNLLEMFKEVKKKYGNIFYQSDAIEFDKRTVFEIVSKFQKYSFMKADVDVIGSAFEVFVSDSLREEYGQFFTPRQVVRFMVEVINPKPEELILDPACGSGGFLIQALHKIRESVEKEFTDRLPPDKLSELKRKIYSKVLFGIDQERDLAKISKAYMAIVGDGTGGIFAENSLAFPSEWDTINRDELKLGNFNVVLTNPPFGKDIKVEGKLLEQFDLARNWKEENGEYVLPDVNTPTKHAVRPSILFLERCFQFLNKSEKDSRMGIVLPVGDLSNDEDRYVKEWLLKKTKIFAVAQLPSETFQPYTGSQTCLLFLEPLEKCAYDHTVFLAQAEKIGKDKRGKTIYKRNEDGSLVHDDNGQLIIDNDLDAIVADYNNYLNGKPIASRLSFLVNGQKLKDSILPNYHNPANALIIGGSARSRVKIESLESLCHAIYSPPRTRRVYVGKQFGIPFLSGSNITQFIPQNVKYISKTQTKNLNEYIVHDGDVVTTRVGTMGIVRYIGKELDGYAVSDNITIIRINRERIRPEYVFAFLYGTMGRKVIRKVAKGSLQHYNTPKAIKQIDIPILPEPEYSQIVKTIEKAERNRVSAVDDVGRAENILGSYTIIDN